MRSSRWGVEWLLLALALLLPALLLSSSFSQQKPFSRELSFASSSGLKVAFAEKLSSGRALTVQAGGKKIEFSLQGTAFSRAERTAEGVLYRNAFTDTDLLYHFYGESVKEELVISGPGAPRLFSFYSKLEGVSAALEKDGSVSFRSTADGGKVFSIPRPFVLDGNGRLLKNLDFGIETLEGATRLSLPLPPELFEGQVNYPLVVDPTIILYANQTGALDGYVNNGSIRDMVTTVMAFGYYSGSNVIDRTFIDFNTSEVPSTSTITSLQLTVFVSTIVDCRNTVNTTSFVNLSVPAANFTDNANGNAVLYGYIGNGTVFVTNNTFNTTGFKTIDLGSTARTTLQNQLGQRWFSLGIKGPELCTETTTSEGVLDTSESFTPTNAPYLTVVYTTDTTAPNVTTVNSPAHQTNASTQSITFNVTATDNVDLKNVSIFYNASGTAWHRNATNSSLTSSNNNTHLLVTLSSLPANTSINWIAEVCDSMGNCAQYNANRTLTTGDTQAPQYSSNSTNSTANGSAVQFRLYWTDNSALSNYTFSFDNGTGSFTNDSSVGFSGTMNWSNVTKFVNFTNGSTIRWIVYAWDPTGNMNASQTYSFVTNATIPTDTQAPRYSSNQTNSTIAGQAVLFSLYWTDDVALSNYTFSFDNGTGSFTNDSVASFSGTTNHSNVTKVVNSTVGSTIRWRVWANDSSNNMNASATYSFTSTSASTTNTAPYSTLTPQISPDPADNLTALNCTARFADTTNSSLTYLFTWYKSNAQNTSLDSNKTSVSNNTSATVSGVVPVALLSVGSTWICSARAFDTTYYSDWVNSTPVEILSNVSGLITRVTTNCPATLTNQAGTIIVSYYKLSKLTCNEINVTVKDSKGADISGTSLGSQKCVSSKAQYSINFSSSGTYTVTASGGGSTSSCTVEYKGVTLLPTRVPDFSILLLPLVAIAAIALARNAKELHKNKKN